MYKNLEGYNDPTAGKAMGQVMKQYKQQQKELWNRQYEMKHRFKVYVVSKYAGDTKTNVANAIRYCRYVITQNGIPVASHLLYPQMLNDMDSTERELGMMFGLALLAECDEVWCFGCQQSQGMEEEIKEAKKLNKPIRYVGEVNG